MTDLPYQNRELVGLFEVYTASSDSIGSHLADLAQRSAADNPLVVATGHDIALYPGGGSPPTVQSYRVNARGFKEVTAISHLGPAMSSLARMKEQDPAGSWRHDAIRLLEAVRGVRAVNSMQLWEDDIAVRAFVGRSERLAGMVDYACAVAARVLERAVSDEGYLSAKTLRADFLDGPAEGLPVPFNRVMVATFFLTGLDISHRLLTWFDALGLEWERAMVVVAGQPPDAAGIRT